MNKSRQELKEELVRMLYRHEIDMSRISALQFELAHLSPVREDDVIESMTFHHADSDDSRPSPGSHSDKTSYTAANYQNRTQAENDETRRLYSEQLRALLDSWERLDHYISVLPPQQRDIIHLHFYDHKKMADISSELGEDISLNTVKRKYTRAIDTLCSMYEAMQISPNLYSALPIEKELLIP